MKRTIILLAGILSLFSSLIGLADDDGDTLAWKVYNRDDGKSAFSEGRMLLVDSSGDVIKRRLRSYVKEFDGYNKSLIIFDSPADIKGTAFLSWEHPDKDDDQFLYLPALGRVRRIVSSNRGNSFVGSDIVYEDLMRRKPNEYDNEIIGEEEYNGRPCYVLKQVPKPKAKSSYGFIENWVDKEWDLVVFAKAYNKKGDLVKTISAKRVEIIDGIPTVTELEVRDIKEDHRTIMYADTVQYNLDLDDSIFTKRAMKNGGQL